MFKKDSIKKIGECLLRDGLIDHEQLAIIIKEQRVTGELIGDIAVKKKFCSRDDVIKTMIKYDFDLIGKNISSIAWPIKLLVDLNSMDKGNSGEIFYIATLHKNPEHARLVAEQWLNENYPSDQYKKVRLVAGDIREIQAFLAENKNISSSTKTKDYDGSIDNETDVNKILEELIAQAKNKRASDIHIIQTEQTVEVKYRVDGVLQISHILDKTVGDKLFPRIKGLTGMDITQTRTSQDGGFSQVYKGRIIDFRVGIKPIKGGEKITIRILDREDPSVNKDIDSLGMPENILESWIKLSKHKNGLILVCGATGSGKTTTLYSTIQAMDCLHLSISTIEDPIEYTLPHITQTQVNRMVTPPIDFDTFVRTELRHDPDVIIVGEVRDSETVKACMHLSDTGHLVYATLHTNDIPTTFSRLEKMDVDLNQLAYSLRGIMVQKLVRKLCDECHGAKCSICNNTGYLGQTLLIEYAEITSADDFFAIKDGKRGFFSFNDDALLKANSGVTDCKELSRVLGHDVTYCNSNSCVRGGEKCM